MSFGSDSSSGGGQQVDPALQRFIAEETEKQKMQVMEWQRYVLFLRVAIGKAACVNGQVTSSCV